MFENLNNIADNGADSAKKYVESSLKYAKLKIFQQLTISIGLVVKIISIGFLLALGLLFMAVASAIAIGNYLNNPTFGYLIMGGFFLLLAVVLYAVRKYIDKKIMVEISRKFFD